jgi:hypothetical protein
VSIVNLQSAIVNQIFSPAPVLRDAPARGPHATGVTITDLTQMTIQVQVAVLPLQ